jgi:GNAT superfamily N-acetyltransferase
VARLRDGPRDVTTRAMFLRLDRPAPSLRGRQAEESGEVPVVADVSPAVVAGLNGTPVATVDGVPGLRCWATSDGTSGLCLQDVGGDVVVSFVATRPDSRCRGLATRVLSVALDDARRRGAGTALLQATPDGEGLYARLGFEPVATWQEWVARR